LAEEEEGGDEAIFGYAEREKLFGCWRLRREKERWAV
jgi:hypothetical protein